MRESCTYGSARGVLSNEHPYRYHSMQRREFIALLGGAATAWPLAARAQKPEMPVLGYLHPGLMPADGTHVALPAIRQGLREGGFVEGQNLTIEHRWAAGKRDRLPELAADLVRREVAVIVTVGLAASKAASEATSSIPIVFMATGDPVEFGIVTSLNRPGGNLTGVTLISIEISSKRLEFLLDLVPRAKTVAQMVHEGASTSVSSIREIADAARALGRESFVVQVRSERDFEAAFATIAERGADALVITSDQIFSDNRRQIITLAQRFRIPTVYPDRESVREGGLMSYGSNVATSYRQVGAYAAQILRGAKPADLPVHRPTHFELMINLKTAKALGLDIPLKLHAFAAEMIE
jgi:putative ABC transport system substrate-binding protein